MRCSVLVNEMMIDWRFDSINFHFQTMNEIITVWNDVLNIEQWRMIKHLNDLDWFVDRCHFWRIFDQYELIRINSNNWMEFGIQIQLDTHVWFVIWYSAKNSFYPAKVQLIRLGASKMRSIWMMTALKILIWKHKINSKFSTIHTD